MTAKPETRVKEKFMELVNALPFSWWEKIQQVVKRGTPDILGCIKCQLCGRGLFVAPELKATEKQGPDALQLHKLMEIRRAGGLSMIVHKGNVEEQVELIKAYASGVSIIEPRLEKESLKRQRLGRR